MKKITKLWMQINECLANVDSNPEFTKELHDKFDEIFDLKDVCEYKAAADTETQTPKQFQHTCLAMRKALVEGYLLAQMEQSRNDIEFLYKCHRKELKDDKANFNIDSYPNIPRNNADSISERSILPSDR